MKECSLAESRPRPSPPRAVSLTRSRRALASSLLVSIYSLKSENLHLSGGYAELISAVDINGQSYNLSSGEKNFDDVAQLHPMNDSVSSSI